MGLPGRFNRAILLGQRGAHDEALELLRPIPKLAPHFGEVYFYIAKTILDGGDVGELPEAIDAAKRGLQLAPQSATAPLGHYVLADIYRLQGRLADSEHEIQVGRGTRAISLPASRRVEIYLTIIVCKATGGEPRLALSGNWRDPAPNRVAAARGHVMFAIVRRDTILHGPSVVDLTSSR